MVTEKSTELFIVWFVYSFSWCSAGIRDGLQRHLPCTGRGFDGTTHSERGGVLLCVVVYSNNEYVRWECLFLSFLHSCSRSVIFVTTTCGVWERFASLLIFHRSILSLYLFPLFLNLFPSPFTTCVSLLSPIGVCWRVCGRRDILQLGHPTRQINPYLPPPTPGRLSMG